MSERLASASTPPCDGATTTILPSTESTGSLAPMSSSRPCGRTRTLERTKRSGQWTSSEPSSPNFANILRVRTRSPCRPRQHATPGLKRSAS
jgi:hypothetical protein